MRVTELGSANARRGDIFRLAMGTQKWGGPLVLACLAVWSLGQCCMREAFLAGLRQPTQASTKMAVPSGGFLG